MTSAVALPSSAHLHLPEDKCEDVEELPKSSSKCLENRSSISSVDSCISLSYDAAPFTPRSSLTNSGSGSSTEDESLKQLQVKFAPSAPPAVEDEPFQLPDQELIKKIVDQVEYYFSDENIVKDAFLLKHVRRNKEGYVSLKLIASFKRVKHIARDWRVVRVALEKSIKLEINESGTKLRRKDPLPLYDQTIPSRTVVALGIPSDKATIEMIAEMFHACGEIALIRILRPGNPIPADVRPFYNKHPQMQESVSALVEFVRTESAHNALNMESAANGIEVLELNAPAKKKVPTKKKALETDLSLSCQSGSETDERHAYKQDVRLQQQRLPLKQKQSDCDWAQQRRWSRDSGSDSCSSRSRSNSGVYFVPDQRRSSAGWESGTDSYSSCRSRSSSGASVPEIFHMRRYSLPRKEQCCCTFQKCDSFNTGRRYSLGRSSDDGYGGRPLSRCHSGENCIDGSYRRRESIPDFYPIHAGNGSTSFERRLSFSRQVPDGQWSRSSSVSSVTEPTRRMSDVDGRFGLTRQRSFGNGIPGETITRLPRGPDGSKGFQRELIEYVLPE